MNVLSAFTRSLESELAGMTRSQRSFHTLRPTSRVEVTSFPPQTDIVEWRRIVAASSPAERVDIQSGLPSSPASELLSYGIGIT